MEDEDLKKKLFLQEVLREDSKFVCNVTVTVFRSTCSKWGGLESGRARSEDLGSPQLFQVGVTVCHWEDMEMKIWRQKFEEECLGHNCFKSMSLFGATFRMP